MRLKHVVLSGFRAFAAKTHIDLDADCIVVSGANGQGKTSLLDGIFWALTGRLDRLGPDDKLVSLYSETGDASVALTLSTEHGELTVTRRFDGQRTTVNALLGGQALEGDELRRRFGQLVAPSSDAATDGSTAFATTLARSLYLQQDAIRDFINADSDDARFRVVAELCGVGKITDLQSALQQERRNWTQSTHQLENQVVAKRTRLSDLRDRASKLSSSDASIASFGEQWTEWWRTLKQVVPAFSEPVPDLSSGGADASLDRAVRALDAARLEAQRRRDALADAMKLLATVGAQAREDLQGLRSRVTTAEQAEAKARESLKAVEARNLVVEHELLQSRSSGQELRTLAELALRHLGERCPVCDQQFDKETTSDRLRQLAAVVDESALMLNDLSPFVEALSQCQSELLKAREALRNAEAAEAQATQLDLELRRRLEQLQIDSAPEAHAKIEQLTQAVAQLLSQIESARSQADGLSLSRARASELAQRAEVLRQLAAAEKDAAEAERVLASRERASRMATTITEEMREASLQIVDAELRRIEPLFQRIWAGIDPHPSLRAVHLISRLSYGKGRLSMRVSDDSVNVSTESPQTVLSSSQQNALAVALFLTLNIGTQSLPLSTTVLDDPFQSLDDINLLGLVDLLRRLVGQRQIIVTTHEHRFAQLLARKLRPISDAHLTKMVEFDSWDRTAPLVTERNISHDVNPFRFVA